MLCPVHYYRGFLMLYILYCIHTLYISLNAIICILNVFSEVIIINFNNLFYVWYQEYPNTNEGIAGGGIRLLQYFF